MFTDNRFKVSLLLLLFLTANYFTSYSQSEDTCANFSINVFTDPFNMATAPCIADGEMVVHINNGRFPFTYLWSNGDTTNTADSLSVGELYSVTVTDADNCRVIRENLQVQSEPLPPQPTINIENNGPEITFTAFGDNRLLDLIVSYRWTIEGITNPPGVQSFTHLFPAAGYYQASVIMTDVCGLNYSFSRPFDVYVAPEEAFTFDIGGAEGQTGDTIALPVRVKNFKNISGFQKSIHLLNEQTGQIIGFRDFNLEGLSIDNFEQKATDIWSMVWFQQDPITLADDHIIYYIDVVLTNTEGECTKITFDDSDIPLQVATSDENNIPMSIRSPWVRTSETCVRTTVALGGQITTPDGRPIKNVTIVNSGADDFLTDKDGKFIIPNLPRSQSYSLSPEKLEGDLNDLTTLDLILILKHILNREQLNSPYKLFAADVNNDRSITVLDLITLQQFILSKIPAMPAGNWIFLPKNFQFANNGNILSTSFPREITTSELQEDQLNYDFIGIRVGDVSYDMEELRR